MEASALRRPLAGIQPQSRRLLGALSDDRLVEQIRRGNTAAFEVAYDRHYRGILSFCRHMLGSREEAEDAVQQTFASAFTNLQSNDRPLHLKAWLYTIARNRCLSVLRARREQPAELDDVPAIAGLSEQVEQRADLRELLHDLHDLPDDQREALVLYEVGDLSQAEVANVIGVGPMKVKALVFQARSSLIENREARAIPCQEIREQLATATGGALRRGPLRRHLRACEGCREYRDQVRDQRRALALVLPVVPTLGLKDSVLAGLGIGGGAGGGGVAAGGAAGGGGLITALGGAGGAKLAVGAVLAAGAIAGTGFGIERAVQPGSDGGAGAQGAQASSGPGGTAAQGGGDPGQKLAAPITNRDDAVATEKRRARDRKRAADKERDERREAAGDSARDADGKATPGNRGNRGRGVKKGGKKSGRKSGGKGGRKGPRPQPATITPGSPTGGRSSSGATIQPAPDAGSVEEQKDTRAPGATPIAPVGDSDGNVVGGDKKVDTGDGRNRVLASAHAVP